MITVLDTETTFFQKGNPFAERNRLCYVGSMQPEGTVYVGTDIEFSSKRHILDDCTLLVGFNPKFDLHWLRRRYGWRPRQKQRVWDCQLAHFLLTAQRKAYPSLEETREYHRLTRATPKGSPDYWARGIDTPDIPKDIILEDLRNDVLDTYAVYQRQLVEFDRAGIKLNNLFRMGCDDLLVLEEMEWNGLNFNEQQATNRANSIKTRITEIEQQLCGNWPDIPINWDSPEHISACLYGGIVRESRKEVVGLYRSGLRTGQPKYQNKEIEHVLPRLTEPMDGTALKKDGYWSTDESILRQLNAAKSIREALLERSKLSKELDYMQGLPELRNEMDWRPNTLHPSFNQCVASTGRLSSSKPNAQNLTDGILQLIESKYADASTELAT